MSAFEFAFDHVAHEQGCKHCPSSRVFAVIADQKKLVLCQDGNSNHAFKLGTSVKFSGFLDCIPVRRNEWERCAKKMLSDILEMLYSYAVAFTSLKLKLTNTDEGSPKVLFEMPAGRDLPKTLSLIFGSASAQALVESPPKQITMMKKL